jgi:HEAT repeat protein
MAKPIIPPKVKLQDARFVADLKSSIRARSPVLPRTFASRAKATVSEIIESLVAAADNRKWQVRVGAAQALGDAAECSKRHHGGQLDDDVGAAVPKLVELLCDRVATVRRAAVIALRSYCPQAATTVAPVLVEHALKDSDPQLASAAQETLRACGQGPASAALGCLIQLLQRDEAALCQAACVTLGWLGIDALPAIKPLVDIVVGDAPESVRIEAAKALAAIDPEGQYVLQALPNRQQLAPLIQHLAVPGEAVSILRRSLLRMAGSKGFKSTTNRGRRGPSVKVAKRNKKIIQAYAAGASHDDVARDFGISVDNSRRIKSDAKKRGDLVSECE